MISPHYRRIREQLAARPKRWLVTGAAGFIGSNIVDDLLALGQQVVGLDNFSTGHRANIDEVLAGHAGADERCTIIEGDIRDLGACQSACDGVDYVLHHAALASVPKSVEDPLLAHAVNVDGFINMLVAAKDTGVARFVFASSSAVYGDSPTQPQIENVIGRPLSPYAANKAINETYASAFQMTYGIETVGLRYYNVFGPRQDPDGAYAAVIPRWIAALLDGRRCVLFGDGSTTRDFCYVANVVQANILAATAEGDAITGQAYNVACEHSVTLNELFFLIKERLAVLTPDVSLAEACYEPFRHGDIRYSSASIARARRMLGFAPSHGVRDGLSEALPWYLAQCMAQVDDAN